LAVEGYKLHGRYLAIVWDKLRETTCEPFNISQLVIWRRDLEAHLQLIIFENREGITPYKAALDYVGHAGDEACAASPRQDHQGVRARKRRGIGGSREIGERIPGSWSQLGRRFINANDAEPARNNTIN